MVTDGTSGHKPDRSGRLDERQALYNDCGTGTAPAIQVPLERIARVHGFVVDVDPDKLEPDNPVCAPAADADEFHRRLRPLLDRHRILAHAGVRATGNGLHLLARFTAPVELATDGDQRRWDEIARLVQASVPSDPAASGLKVLTRPVGATNTKNGRTVRDLVPGTPIEPAAVEAFVEELLAGPFRCLARIFLCADREVAPCPFCRAEASRLAILDSSGTCYHCGNVAVGRLFALAARRDPADASPAPRGRAGRRKGGRHE